MAEKLTCAGHNPNNFINRREALKFFGYILGGSVLAITGKALEPWLDIYVAATNTGRFSGDPNQLQNLGRQTSGGDQIQAVTSGEINANAELNAQRSGDPLEGPQQSQMIVVGEGEKVSGIEASGPYGQSLECSLTGVHGEVEVNCTDPKGNKVRPVDVFTSDGPNALIPGQPVENLAIDSR